MNQRSATPGVVEPADGWQDGAPVSVPSESVVIDVRTYRRVTCAGCGKRGMKAVPQHNGEQYRILYNCRVCRHRETFEREGKTR